MFIAHKNDLLNQNNVSLIQFDDRKFVSKDSNLYRLFSNVCPHQGSLLVQKESCDIKCKYHGWAWDKNGNPISNGTTKMLNEFNIKPKLLDVQKDLIFTTQVNLEDVSEIDLSHMSLVEKRIDQVNATYRTIIDVFLDVDHIPVVHKDLYENIGIAEFADVSWKYYDWGNVQLVNKSIDYSKEFKSTLLGIPEERLSAFWITIYPYTMIEWQPGAMFITVCKPSHDNLTAVSVFKYRDLRYNDCNWKINSSIWETAWEQDKDLCKGIVNINSKFLEESKLHFRQWLKDNDELRI